MDSTTEQTPKGFDLRVTHRDEKTGLITHTTPYTLRVIGNGSGGGTTKLWERPSGSGNLWNKKGDPIGRWVKDEKGVGRWDKEAKHIDFTPPETKDQKLAREVAAKDVKIAEMERELAAIRAEQEKSAKPATKKEQGA